MRRHHITSAADAEQLEDAAAGLPIGADRYR
jgi:hypothetical protein